MNVLRNHKSEIINLKSQKGFTLIEIVTVMAMIVIISSLSIIVGLDAYRSFVFRTERNTLVMVLQVARSQAINNVCLGSGCSDGKPHGVEIQPSQYVIFQGSPYNQNDPLNQAFPATSLVTHSGATEVDFTRLSGTSTAQSIALSDGTHSDTITVNSEGRIDW